MPLEEDGHWLSIAAQEAREGMQAGEGGPFGALVVLNGQVIGRAHNEVLKHHDPTAHAEMLAIRRASRHLRQHQLTGATLYTTCEPCPMCLGAILWSRLARVVYASSRQEAASGGFDDAYFHQRCCHPQEDTTPCMEQRDNADCAALWQAWQSLPDRQGY